MNKEGEKDLKDSLGKELIGFDDYVQQMKVK